MRAVALAAGESWQDVCPASALIENGGICALIRARQIAIFQLGSAREIFAIDNYDPFSHAAVLSRGVVGDLRGQPVVASPIYKHHFNLETGHCLEDPAVKVATYPVRVTNDILQVMVAERDLQRD